MQTLDIFIKEAGLPYDAATADRDDLTIEKVLEEKKTFDLSVRFEKLGRDDGAKEWSSRGGFAAPFSIFQTSSYMLSTKTTRSLNRSRSITGPAVADNVPSLPSRSNILHVSASSYKRASNRQVKFNHTVSFRGASRS